MLQSQLLQLSFEADEVSFGLAFIDLDCVALCFNKRAYALCADQ